MRHVRMLARRVQLTLARDRHSEDALGASRHLAADPRHSMLASWRLFHRWAILKRYVMVDPTATVEGMRVPVRMPRIAPDRAITLALQGASHATAPS
ncbi:hypothetical protein [Microbacterium paraoxydans]|uniref:hypothetical protein n=1 Tax=Microbacterium paraoxydans TaxID=199592 RepID=UPI0021A3132F|nr:hypothetical protein [Microbacterium paraoxydans]MCT2223607.1 hypothetical protein [Microbacterium paraoxydans]